MDGRNSASTRPPPATRPSEQVTHLGHHRRRNEDRTPCETQAGEQVRTGTVALIVAISGRNQRARVAHDHSGTPEPLGEQILVLAAEIRPAAGERSEPRRWPRTRACPLALASSLRKHSRDAVVGQLLDQAPQLFSLRAHDTLSPIPELGGTIGEPTHERSGHGRCTPTRRPLPARTCSAGALSCGNRPYPRQPTPGPCGRAPGGTRHESPAAGRRACVLHRRPRPGRALSAGVLCRPVGQRPAQRGRGTGRWDRSTTGFPARSCAPRWRRSLRPFRRRTPTPAGHWRAVLVNRRQRSLNSAVMTSMSWSRRWSVDRSW